MRISDWSSDVCSSDLAESYIVADVRGAASYSHTPVLWLALDDWRAVTGADAPTVVATSEAADVPEGYTSVALGDSLRAIGSYSSQNASLRLSRGFLLVIPPLVFGAFFTAWPQQHSRADPGATAMG